MLGTADGVVVGTVVGAEVVGCVLGMLDGVVVGTEVGADVVG